MLSSQTLMRSFRLPIGLTALASMFAAYGCGDDEEPAKPKPSIVTFTAASSRVTSGGSVLLTYEVKDATSVKIDSSPGGSVLATTAILKGTATSSQLTERTTFTLSATGEGGVTTRDLIVEVDPAVLNVSIETFAADPTSIDLGGSSTLSYVVRNGESAKITAGPTEVLSTTELSGSVMVSPTMTTTYTLEATGVGGPVTRTVSVAVNTAPSISSFTVTPMAIDIGGSATLEWAVLRATQLVISDGAQEVYRGSELTGSRSVSPVANTTYTLTATNEQSESDTAMVTLTVNPPEGAHINSFTATPSTVDVGASFVLAWDVSNAPDGIEISKSGRVLHGSSASSGSFTTSSTVAGMVSYTLTAKNPAGESTSMVTVNVEIPTVSVVSFGAAPSEVLVGGSSTLSWTTDRATGIEISDRTGAHLFAGTGTIAATGSLSVTLTSTGTERFTLRATNAFGEATQVVDVRVHAPATIVELSADPSSYVGTSTVVTVTWSTSSADHVELWVDGVIDSGFPGTASGEYALPVTGAATLQLHATNAVSEATSVLISVRAFIAKDVNTSSTSPMVLAGDGTGVAGRISVQGESDWFLVSVADGQGIVAHTECVVDSIITVYDSQLNVVARNDDGGTGGQFCSSLAVGDLEAGDYLVEVSPYNTSVGDYVVFIEVRDPECGNGLEETRIGESCDDGNLDSGDGCSATCSFEGELEREPNDTLAEANPMALPVFLRGALMAGDADWYAIAVPAGHYLEVSVTSPGPAGCAPGNRPTLSLFDASEGWLASGQPTPGVCELIGPTTSTTTVQMPAGTYYVRVMGTDPADLPRYHLFAATIAPGCGNGYRDSGEACDDGNGVAGDGCDSSCQLEIVGSFIGPQAGNQSATGGFPAGGSAIFQIVMGARGYLRAETFVPGPPDCAAASANESDTVVTLYDDQWNVVARDDEGGVGHCSLIPSRAIEAGTYFLHVTPYVAGASIPVFTLVVRLEGEGCGNGVLEAGETCDDGNSTNGDGCDFQCRAEGLAEAEPNDVYTTAQTALPARYIGTIGGSDVTDFYAVGVSDGGHVLASVATEVVGSCQLEPLDLTFFGPDGTTVLAHASGGSGSAACSSLHPNLDPEVRSLAAGRYYLAVTPTNLLPGAEVYYLDVDVVSPGCGNAVSEGTEQCDDGNLDSGDGCDPLCNIEVIGLYAYPNPGGRQSFVDSILVAGTIDRYGIEMGTVGILRVETFSDSVAGTCTFDSVVRLYDSQGNTVDTDDDDGVGTCSLIVGRRLEVGSYLLTVEDFGNDGTIPTYEIVFEAIAADVCGNALLEAGEECDDGNLADSDGCSAACENEVDASYLFPVPGGAQVFTSSIAPVGGHRTFELVIDEPMYLHAETFEDALAGTCASVDTLVDLLDSQGGLLTSNDDGGIGNCSLISDYRLGAGRYFLRVVDYGNNNVIPRFDLLISGTEADICGNGLLEPGEVCDDGNISSGDGCAADCTYEVAGSVSTSQTVSADLSAGAVRVFEVVVTAGQSIEAITHDVGDVGACTNGTRLRLLDSTFTELVSSTVGGPGTCAAILVPESTEATSLLAGSYYLVVEPITELATHLVEMDIIILDPGCGNGVLETGEECDDGNSISGDGCSDLCVFEGVAEVEPNNSTATANDSGLVSAGEVHISGSHPAGVADQDFFRFEVPTGQTLNLTAHTYSQAGNPASICPPAAGLDTAVALYDAAGVRLVRNDDASPGNYCSLITRSLAAGVYYVEVEYWNYPSPPSSLQSYFLQISLAP